MIAPEYFNNHVAVEGEIIVKSVPNDAGFVLVWNPTTKKISRRTNAEIVSDLNLVTSNQLGNYWQRYNGSSWNEIRSDKAVVILDELGNQAQNIYTGGLLVSNVYADSSNIPTNGIYSKGNIATLNYGSAIDWAIAYNWTQTQGATRNWVTDNFVSLNTPQVIPSRKSFGGATGNNYDQAALEVRGDGVNIFPSIGFHQPGDYAGTISFRNDSEFSFMNLDGTGYKYLRAAGYIKEGSNDGYVLTGAGGHKPISDFATTVNLNDYIPKTHPSYGITQTNINDWYWYKGFIDNRSIKPVDIEPLHLQFGFTSIDNNNTFPYADFLHFGGYQDSSGGNQNLIVINKTGWGIRQYQGDWQSTDPYTEYVDYWNTGNLPNPVNQSQLGNYVTINTPQTIIANKTFAPTSEVAFLGNEQNQVDVWKTSSSINSIVSGHIYHFYNTRWKVGNKRGGSSDSLGYAFQFSSDGGANYSEQVLIQPDGNILTSNFGSASDWNAKVDQSQLAGYVKTTGDQSIDGIKGFTGAYTQWILDGDSANARGFVQPTPNEFLLGTLNNKNVSIYRNSIEKVVVEDLLTTFRTNISVPNAIQNDHAVNLGQLANYQPLGQYVRIGGTGTTGNNILIGWTGSELQATVDATTIGNLWHSGNFNPNSKINALQNAVAIGFSSGNTPTDNGIDYPYIYHNTSGFIPIATQSFVHSNFHRIDFTGGITNGSDGRSNKSFFDYSWAGKGYSGSVINFSGLNDAYSTELFAQYNNGGNNIGIRSRNGDAGVWNDTKWLFHTGNFSPDSKVNKLGDTMTGALLIGNNNIGKQRVLHLAEPTLLDYYGFNFYTDTNTGLLTLHGQNNGLSNSAPILSANRANNFVGINKENPTTELDVNGNITSNGFIKNNSSDDYFLMGGGGQLTKYSKDDAFVNSYRDFTDGTLITTNIDYSQTQGESFLLEIKGNMYGGGIPMDTKVQGYIYADTIINQSGYSTYADLTTIIAMNINGNLCFWFPRLSYWQGFSVKAITTGGGGQTTVNRVVSIDNSAEPVGTKQVKIAIYTLSTQNWVNNQGFLTSANLNSYVTQSALNAQLGSYATLNGIQTFANTNTFLQSPVIPNGTIGVHAVNLNQLLDVAPPYHWNYVGHSAIANRRVLSEITWNNYGNGHTIFDISSGTTPWGASKSNVDAEQPWNPSYPTLVGGNGSGTYGVRVDSARNADNLGGIPAGNYATQTWVDSNFISQSHPVNNITQANINSWNAAAGGSSHTHSNLSYLNNIDQYLGTGQAPQFSSVRLMNSIGYGTLALEEDYIGGEAGLVDLSNEVFYAGRINEYIKYGSSVNGFEGLNIHFDAKLLGIGREAGNHEDKVQIAGDLSVDTVDIDNTSMQLILNPLYNTDGDVRRSRNAHIYIVTRETVRLPQKPILGQRIEIFNDSDSYIEVTHDNVGTMFKVPGFCKVTGIAANKGFKFDAKPVDTKQYDI